MYNDLKEIMKQEFDKDKNYNKIISEVERVSDLKEKSNIKKLKIKNIIAPAVAFIALFVVILWTNNINIPSKTLSGKNNAEQNNTENNNKSTIKIALDINEMENLEMAISDAAVEKKEITNIPEKFTFINNATVPEEYKIENCYTLYTRSDKNSDQYNLLHDYVLNYRKDDTNSIKISFSEIEKPIRDYDIMNEENKISKIGENEVTISHYKEMYIVYFKYNNIYFDIETVGISQEELVNLLTSIIK